MVNHNENDKVHKTSFGATQYNWRVPLWGHFWPGASRYGGISDPARAAMGAALVRHLPWHHAIGCAVHLYASCVHLDMHRSCTICACKLVKWDSIFWCARIFIYGQPNIMVWCILWRFSNTLAVCMPISWEVKIQFRLICSENALLILPIWYGRSHIIKDRKIRT